MKNILISWFPFYHGISYIKNVLAAFYSGKIELDKKIDISGLVQEELNEVFDRQRTGFMFDKIYILTPPDKLYRQRTSSVIFRKRNFYEKDEKLKEAGLIDLSKEVIAKELKIEDEIEFIKKNYPDKFNIWMKLLWRNIQHYSPTEQIWWLRKWSNLPEPYKERFEFVKVETDSLRNIYDYENAARTTWEQYRRILKNHKEDRQVFITSLTPAPYTVSWFSLAQAGILPEGYKFIDTYDLKDTRPGKRFKEIYIREIPGNLISIMASQFSLYPETSPELSDRETELKFKTYLNQGFSILIMGERGTGKSYMAEKNSEEILTGEGKFIVANCASFINSDIAAAELFGYEKGAFTGATKSKKGLIEEAQDGILFLDEVHTLPKDIQFKLMRAFATDKENRMKIRRLGANKEISVKLKNLIFATNRSISELRQDLLPDFFDRIVQLVVEIPPLRKTPENIPLLFEKIWLQLKFDQFYSFKEKIKPDNAFFQWLKQLSLPGNYRDLQRIAIVYKTYLDFPRELTEHLPEKSPFEYAKKHYEKYIDPYHAGATKLLPRELNLYRYSPKELEKRFKKELACKIKEVFGSFSKAEMHYNKTFGEKEITRQTLDNWCKMK